MAFFIAESGYEVHVVTSRLRYDEPGKLLPSEEVVNGVNVHRVWTSRFGRDHLLGRAFDYVTFCLSSGWCLLRLTRRDDTVVAKTDPPLISVVAALVVRWRRAKLVNWVQDVFPEVAAALGVRGLGGAFGSVLRRLRDLSLRQAQTNVALSDSMASYFIERGVSRDRVRVIPNWVDDVAIVPIRRDQNPLRELWGLAGKFVVVYSGNMGRAHEFDTILDAIARLKRETGIVFLFIGGGNQKAYLESEAAKRGLSQVQFRPYQAREELAESLGLADVHLISLRPAAERFVVPSKFYGAAAAGRPIVFVGDPDGDLAKTVQSGNCGVVVPPKESERLAAGLLGLRDNQSLWLELGRNARRLIDERFSRRRAMKLWQEALTIHRPAP